MKIVSAIRELLPRRDPPVMNLTVEVRYTVAASKQQKYFTDLEKKAAERGLVGELFVTKQGYVKPGSRPGLPEQKAILLLDEYPNPSAVEGRRLPDYAGAHGARVLPPKARISCSDGRTRWLVWEDDRLKLV